MHTALTVLAPPLTAWIDQNVILLFGPQMPSAILRHYKQGGGMDMTRDVRMTYRLHSSLSAVHTVHPRVTAPLVSLIEPRSRVGVAHTTRLSILNTFSIDGTMLRWEAAWSFDDDLRSQSDLITSAGVKPDLLTRRHVSVKSIRTARVLPAYL